MRKVVLASEQQATETKSQPQNLQIVLTGPEGTLAGVDTGVVARAKTRVETIALEGTLLIEDNVDTISASEAALISTLVQNQM